MSPAVNQNGGLQSLEADSGRKGRSLMSHNARLRRIFALYYSADVRVFSPTPPLPHRTLTLLSLHSSSGRMRCFWETRRVSRCSTAPARRHRSQPRAIKYCDAEVNFWISLNARQMNIDVVQTSSPQPALEVIAFRLRCALGSLLKGRPSM